MLKLRVLVLWGIALALPFSARADAVLTFGSPTGQLTPGSLVTIPVELAGVNDLFAYFFGLSYDPNALQLVSVSEGSFLPSAGATFFDLGIIDNSIGQANSIFGALLLLQPGTGASGSGDIAHLTFLLSESGQTSISFQDVFLVDQNFSIVPVSVHGASIVVTPEPGTLALVSLSLGYLYLLRKKLRLP